MRLRAVWQQGKLLFISSKDRLCGIQVKTHICDIIRNYLNARGYTFWERYLPSLVAQVDEINGTYYSELIIFNSFSENF